MQSSTAAIALVRRERDGKTQWLARWSHDPDVFTFVGGHKADGESYRDCLICEVIEGLGLEPEADFVVADTPQSQLEYMGWADGTRQETAYTMELYSVQLTGDFAHDKIDSDADNRWLWETEIQNRETSDGKPISGTMNLLLELAGLLNTNQSDSNEM
ncbi:MAG: NUDIX hydrolase [Planctomycetaceae bacterium]|nr:NUDIX hydrolase [Planctomycetaceae bacterium]